MAKNTQEAEVVITMNGKAAQNALAALRKQQEQCNDAIKAGIDAQKELDKLRSTSIGDYQKVEGRSYVQQMKHLEGIIKKGKEGASTLRRLKDQINVTELATKKYAEVLKNINGSSLAELQAVAKQLKFEIRQLPPDTQKFIDKTKQLKDVNTRINQLTTSFKGLVEEEKRATFSLKGLADGFNKYFGMVTAGIAAITGVSMAFRKAAQDAAALDDIYADVMKTTGLLHEQVADLDKALMRIDTRTSREQLLLLARDAGKLGITGKENILGFVRAADQIQVALGEDLGEGAIRNLGKIADVLGYTSSLGIEKSLLSIGSAINAVGQASTASESYLVDFTQRMSGVAAQTGISAANIIGFASGLDQSAMKVEMASTAFQKFLMKLYEDPAKFAAYANLEVGKFTDLLKNDANQAVITILKALKDQDGFASLVPIFKDMGLDGARAVSVLAAMATNINAVTDAQALANEEFAKATSVTEEYNTKNNNLQAQLEKARKEFQNASITLGQSLNPIMLKTTKATTYLIKALATHGKEIKAAIISVVAFTAAVKASAIMQTTYNVAVKATNALIATWKALVWAVRVAFYKLIGAQEAATIAQQQLNAAMSSNVFGLMATAVAMATVAITRFVKKQREAAEAADWERKVEEEATKAYAEQASTVITLTKIINSNNVSLDERKKALEELKEIVPGYHADLTEEGRLINNNTEALSQYIAELKKSARVQARRKDIEEREQTLQELEDKLEEAKAREARAQANMTPAKMWEMQNLTDYEDPVIEEFQEATAAREALENQIKSLSTTQEQAVERLGKLTQINTDGLTAEEVEIAAVKKEYEDLFQTIREESRFTPGGGEDLIAEKRIELQKKIAEIRQRYNQTETDDGGGGGGGSGLTDKEAKKAFDARIKQLQQQFKTEELELKQSLARKEISQAEYNARIYVAHMENLRLRLEAAQQYGQDSTDIQNEFLDMQIKAIEEHQKEVESINEAFANVERANKKKEEEEQKKQMEATAKRLAQEQEILEQDLARVKERIGEDTWKEELAFEMWKLEELHDQGILSERTYQEAKLKIKLEYAQKAANQVNQIAEMASNFVTALKESESAQLEAEYQKQLTAAGDNAEQREAIEAEYEQKKLDLQKKYADTEMVINIAKAIAAGALAAIEAFAAAGNPILGAVFAAIIAATTALEVATIVKQRNAIKNTSVGGGGSTSVPKTGERKMTGYAEGGYTEDHTTLTTVGEKGREWVGPAWMVRRNPVMFANLERYRKSGSHGRSGSMSRGFADGGFTDKKSSGIDTSISQQDILNAIKEGAKEGVKEGLDGEYINAIVQYGDILIAAKKYENFKKQTTR